MAGCFPSEYAVYMAQHDRAGSRAAVATLFESKQQALACYERAIELLKEGLPQVTITRVVSGESVILRMDNQ